MGLYFAARDTNPSARPTRLVEQMGPAFYEDPQRCAALLAELASDRRRENSVLITALRAGVAGDLLAAAAGYEAITIERLVSRLVNEYGVDVDASSWAVETWAHTLGRGASPPRGPTGDHPGQGGRIEGVNLLLQQQVEVNGLPGYYYLYTYTDAQTGQQGVHAHYFLFQGKKMNSLVFQAQPSTDFQRLAPIFDQVANSFHLPPGLAPAIPSTTAAP